MIQFEVDRSGSKPLSHSGMTDRSRNQPKRPRDLNQRAASTVTRATGAQPEHAPEPVQAPKPTPEERHAAAVAPGRLGGKKGRKARAAKMTVQERREGARKAAQACWANR